MDRVHEQSLVNWSAVGCLFSTRLSSGLALVALAACSGSPALGDLGDTADLSASAGDASTPSGPPDLDPGPRSTYSSDEAQAARQACTFKRGTLPGLSQAKDAPVGPQIPIDHIVVVMMENRSFDHLLGNLKAYGQADADVPTGSESNLDPGGVPVSRFHLDGYCFADTHHSWSAVHAQFNDGKMDGFVTTNAGDASDPTGHRAMGYYTEADIPYFYSLASTFAIGDRFFCDLLGPTQPNRDYLYAATSYGRTRNDLFSDPRDNVMELLNTYNVDWHGYYDGAVPALGIFLDSYARNLKTHFSKLPDFFDAAREGRLESVVFVDPDLAGNQGGAKTDLHPPGNVQLGEQFLYKIADAVMQSPNWSRTALFITFDEHGGQYDHVPPPSACPPDDIPPELSAGDPMVGFDRYGIRVPFIVISPWARPHFVSHQTYSNASITRFIESRFVLPAMTARDANSSVPLDLFDFTSPHFATPPKLTAPTVNPTKAAECTKQFP